MHYLDASSVVAALVPDEIASVRVLAWLGDQGGSLAISPWVLTEVSSALSIKVRTGALTFEQRADILTEWRRMQDGLTLLSVERAEFVAAARMVERYDLGLRAGDALHIAVAQGAGCVLVTLDKVMARAAAELGVVVAKMEN